MSFLSSRKRGFTLVEITIAVAIVAVVSSAVIGNLQDSRKKGRDTLRVSDLQQIQLALRAYRDANSSDYPASASGELLSATGVGAAIAEFFPETVVDPLSGTSGYGYYYDSDYNCGGSSHVVLIARTMERSSGANYVSKCGASYSTTGGMTPTANSYVLILK